MKNILVMRPGAIGDALLTFPVLKTLRECYDGTCLTLLTNAQVLTLAKAFGVAERTIDFQHIQWSELFSSQGILTASLRDFLVQIDLAICWIRDPEGLVEHNLKAMGIRQVMIAPGRPPAGEHLHIIDYLAQSIGLPPTGTLFFTRLESQSSTVGARVDGVRLGGPLWSPARGRHDSSIEAPTPTSKRYIAIHPGSGSEQKCWPVFRFAEIIERLWKQKQPVLLLSGPADTQRIEDLLQLLSPSPAPEMFNILTSAPLLEVAQHLQLCRCYLGNDSGITHLAALLGVPTVAIFGPTDPQVWRPIGPSVKVIHEPKLEALSANFVYETISFYASGVL